MKHRWFHRHKLWFVHIFPILCTPFVSFFFSILLGHNKNQQTWIWICFLNDATAVHRCHPLFGSKCGISVLIGLRSQQRPKSAGHAMVDATEQILDIFFMITPSGSKNGGHGFHFSYSCFLNGVTKLQVFWDFEMRCSTNWHIVYSLALHRAYCSAFNSSAPHWHSFNTFEVATGAKFSTEAIRFKLPNSEN